MTYPILRRNRCGSVLIALTPATQISPEVGSTMRFIIFRVVVLPHPDGPTSTTISPSDTSNERSPTAGEGLPGNDFETCSRRIMASVIELPAGGGSLQSLATVSHPSSVVNWCDHPPTPDSLPPGGREQQTNGCFPNRGRSPTGDCTSFGLLRWADPAVRNPPGGRSRHTGCRALGSDQPPGTGCGQDGRSTGQRCDRKSTSVVSAIGRADRYRCRRGHLPLAFSSFAGRWRDRNRGRRG